MFLRSLASPALLLLVLSGALVCAAPAQQTRKAQLRIQTDLVPGTEVLGGGELRFNATVRGPGTKVSLRLLNPPPGLVFDPVVGARGNGQSSARWLVPDTSSGRYVLVLEARDSLGRLERLEIPVTVLSEGHSMVRHGDVTGDGMQDVVVGAWRADQSGTGDAGRIYVYAGGGLSGSVGPTATLSAAAPASGDFLGETGGQGIQLADVTGDGVLDVVAGAAGGDVSAANTGVIYVWSGGAGLSGSVSPSARQRISSAVTGDRLGEGTGLGIQIADVTSDGVLDVIAQALRANIAGVTDTGAVYVWAGGGGLTGTVDPTASLLVAGAGTTDSLCGASGQGVRLGDVTNDGVLDIVAGAPLALDIDFFLVDFGAIYVWAGGAGLTGTPAPLATLSVPGAASGDRLGSASGAGIQLADLDGDSILDILAGASNADVGGTADTGAIYLFSGGAGLTGAVGPSATLSVPGAIAGDQLGLASGQAILVGELTGDGQLDVLAGASAADVGGISDAGAVYLWAGGPGLSGSVGPLATLALASPLASDELGNGTGRSIQLADVTGDGQSDVIVSAILRGASDQGDVFGWTGGAALTGAVSPAWSMTGSSGDRLGDAPSQGVQLADVSGDGVLDIVAGSSNADVLGTVDAGALHVRIGGPGLSGSGVDWTLTDPGRMTGDQLGNAFSQGVHLGDVTGDGVVDVVAGASSADLTVADAGKILVWKGGPTTPGAPATLRVVGATAGDQLGFVFEGLGIQLADLTGDGVLDVVSGSLTTDTSRGAVYLWQGGASLAGLLSPSATLSVPGAISNDRLGEAGGQGIQLADVDGDGVLDLVGAAEFANVALVSDTGAVYVWRGGAGISGPVGPSATLSVPGAAAMDRLGAEAGFRGDALEHSAPGRGPAAIPSSRGERFAGRSHAAGGGRQRASARPARGPRGALVRARSRSTRPSFRASRSWSRTSLARPRVPRARRRRASDTTSSSRSSDAGRRGASSARATRASGGSSR